MKTCKTCNKEFPLTDFPKAYVDEKGNQRYRPSCKPCFNNSRRESSQKNWRSMYRATRKEAIAVLGGKCVRCGFNDIRALQVDHINGGGCKESAYQTYRKAIDGSKEYQCLCANCNWIKRAENDENPKRGPRLT